MPVSVRSVPQILSEMVRKVLAETPLTDVSPGSVLSTILEAAAISDYQNNLSVIKLLESSRIESLTGTDLDNKAIEMSVPNGVGGFGRKPATRSNGKVTIGSLFSKKSTSLYLAKPAPYAGSTVLYVQDAAGWPTSGQVYVGRGTTNEEGPIPYASISFHINYYAIQLNTTSPLIKNHKYEDSVILSQGGIRTISAGTSVISPAIDGTPQVAFVTDSQVRLLDGEDTVSVNTTAVTFGEDGNVASGAIKMFSASPFPGATVTNDLAFSNGKPAESDEQLRQRIRNHYSSLSRGTRLAVIGSLQGLRDPSSGKTITSINLIEPTVAGEPARCFVDDGSGLEPSFSGQTFETLLKNAYGQEVLFRTSRFPVSSCVVTGSKTGPYQLTAGWELNVQRDGLTETFVVRTEDYININSVQPSEIVNAFNAQGNKIRFRTASGGQYVSVFDLDGDAETLNVLSGNLQKLLGFTTTENRTIFLYQNNNLLSFKGKTATLQSNAYPWGSLLASDLSNVVVKVDGVQQTFTITDLDFQTYGTSISTASLDQWAAVFMKKVAGVHAYAATSSNGADILVWQTWQSQSSSGSLEIISGGWVGNNKVWPIATEESPNYDVGAAADFDFNRLSGQIRLRNAPTSGDMITLGSELTRATVYSLSAESGSFGAGISDYGNPILLLAFDGTTATRTMNIPLNTPVACTRYSASSNLVRLDFGGGGEDYLTEIQPGDFIYLVSKASLGANAVPTDLVGLYRVKFKDGQYLFIQTTEDKATAFDGLAISVSTDVMYGFQCDGTMPQVVDLTASPILTIDSIVSIINEQIVGGSAVKLSPRKFYIRTNSYSNVTGKVSLFASIGTAFGIILPDEAYSLQSHTSYKLSSELDGGFAKVQSVVGPTIPADFYPNRGFLFIEPTKTSVLDTDTNPAIEASSVITSYPIGLQELFLTGTNIGSVSRAYNNETVAPFPGFARGDQVFKPFAQTADIDADSRYENLSLRLEDLPISYADRLVVEMDEDPVNGIYGITMNKSALVKSMSSITGGAKGSQIVFTLKDPEDEVSGDYRSFFDPLSAFRDFDFTDFNILFRPFAFHSVFAENTGTNLPDYASQQKFMLYSTQFGPTNRIKASIVYPSIANSSLQIFHKNYFDGSAVVNHVFLVLPSGNTVATYNASYTIESYSLDVTDFGSKIVEYIIRSYDGSAINLGLTYKVGDILVIGGGNSTYSGSYLITSVSFTEIHVAAPGVRASSYPVVPVRLEAAVNPLFSMENPGISISSLMTAINTTYMPENPMVTASFVGSDDSVLIKYPTYYTEGSETENLTLESIGESTDYHSVSGSNGGIAHIHTYDSSLDEIRAVVQSDEAVLPTTAEMSGTTYVYANEQCFIVPANIKSLTNWLRFTAVSGLSTRAEVDVVNAQDYMQFSSKEKGSAGAVAISGVTANSQDVPLLTVPALDKFGSILASIQFASAQTLPRGTLVELSNTQPVKYGRPFRTVPSSETGYSVVTAFNTPDSNTHFRDTTEVVYERFAAGVGKFTFKASPSGYVPGVSSIRITKVDDIVAKITSLGTNNLNARVGDMMVLNASLSHPTYSCLPVTTTLTDQYVGYPVIHVASLQEIYVVAPNATAGDTDITLTDELDLRFIPIPFAEKNIRSHYMPGIKYTEKESGKEALYYRIKTLGNGMVFAEFSYGDFTTREDLDMLLNDMSVNTDDWIEFSDAFAPQNQGKFRIIAHNGKNCFVFKNHITGGIDEVVSSTDYWGMGPIGDIDTLNTDKRHVRIWDSESVVVGSRLVVTTPQAGAASWFSNPLIGSWNIKELGIDSDYDFYVICDIPAAPSSSETVVLGASASSVYFQESPLADSESSRPFSYKWVAGYAHTTGDSAYADLFLTPQTSLARMLPTYGTIISAMYKIGFSEDIDKGLDAYRYYTELLAEAHKVIDGSSANSIDYPGVRALGSAIEIVPPLIKSVTMSLTVLPGEGIDLNSVKLPIKSTITSYINNLGVGQEVILSEIIKRVQQVPGVKSIVIDTTSPADVDGIISTGSYEVARVVEQDDIGI